MADVFISHSSIDKELADKVCKTLEARGLKCWIAPRDIMPGSEWAVAISNAISVVRAMVVIYSKNSAKSTQVPKEIALAEKRGKFILPYKIDDTELEGAFDYYLTGAHWIVADPEKGEYKFEEMYGVLAGVLQMPVQSITTNLYIDNITIQSSAPEADKVKDPEEDKHKATEEKTAKRKPSVEAVVKEKSVAEEVIAEKMAMPDDETEKIRNKKWFWLAGVLIAVLLGTAVFLIVMLLKPEKEDDADWSEYEEDSDWDEYEDDSDGDEYVDGEDWEEDDSDEFEPDIDEPGTDDWDSGTTSEEIYEYVLCDGGICISEYTGEEQYVVLPSDIDGIPVKEIGAFAFSESEVISVVIPEGVTNIAYAAFFECAQLEAVELPESLLVIEEWAFGDTALKELAIPYGIKRVEKYAFQDSEDIVLHCWGESYTYAELTGFYIDEEE